jgi:hypothetical protein
MFALPPKADMTRTWDDVRSVPTADVATRPMDQPRAPAKGAAARGRISQISVNSPGRVPTSIRPACRLTTMSWLAANGEPMPCPNLKIPCQQ